MALDQLDGAAPLLDIRHQILDSHLPHKLLTYLYLHHVRYRRESRMAAASIPSTYRSVEAWQQQAWQQL